MNLPIYDTQAPKKASNLTINSSLLKQAKLYKINISQTLEQALIEKVAKKQQQEWLKNNKEALESYNERIEERGIFSDGLRNF